MSKETCEELQARVSELEQDLQRYKVMETAVKTARTLIAVMELDSTYLYVNGTYQTLLGYAPQELIGKKSLDFNHPQDVQRMRNLLGQYVSRLADNGAVPLSSPVEYRFRHRDGSWRWLESIGAILDNRLYSFSHDITRRKQSEQERQRMQAQLIAAARLASIGNLSAGLAHELNNPLTAVIGNAEMIQRDPVDIQSVATRARRIRSAAKRMVQIVDHIHRFSRRSRFDERQHLDINTVIRNTLEMLDPLLREREIQLGLELAEDLPRVAGEPVQLATVLQNLIVNAMDAFAEATTDGQEQRIRLLTARQADGGVQIVVEDNAGGMSEEVARQVFDPFFTTKEMGQGAGLGLFASRGIVHDYDGAISMSTEPGIGTRFEIYFPEAR